MCKYGLFQDIALLSLANMLHQTTLYDDALLVTNMAMEASPRLVALHFTVANIYAAKVSHSEHCERSSYFDLATLDIIG